MRVMSLTPEEINKMPPQERSSILQLVSGHLLRIDIQFNCVLESPFWWHFMRKNITSVFYASLDSWTRSLGF